MAVNERYIPSLPPIYRSDSGAPFLGIAFVPGSFNGEKSRKLQVTSKEPVVSGKESIKPVDTTKKI